MRVRCARRAEATSRLPRTRVPSTLALGARAAPGPGGPAALRPQKSPARAAGLNDAADRGL
eukprot:10940477-Alexandrium_andersonii.AAC.1